MENGQLENLQTRKLVKAYGKRRVVDGVDVRVEAGEVVGLLGPNGAGKTTTFYMVVGLVRPSDGQVFLGTREITKMPMYKRARLGIGYLPQEASVFRKLTVEQNLRAVAETLKVSRAKRRESVEEHLDELHLTHLAKQPAYSLSGGERRRLEISRALVKRPKFLLMDEPFAAIDPISVSEVQDIIRKLKEKRIGVLLTDHNVRETLNVVDRAYLIHEGRELSQGSQEFLVNDPQARKIYLGERFNM